MSQIINTTKDYLAAPIKEQFWRFELAPKGVKVQLLTIGGISVYGLWYGRQGQYFVAWAPLLKKEAPKVVESCEEEHTYQ